MKTKRIGGENSSSLVKLKKKGVADTELNLSLSCKPWSLHGGDCEECHLLGYETPLRTSQETLSATEPSRLMLCKT
jgi:hypothetical protein